MESFQWMAQEVQQARGNAALMKIEKFEGVADSELIEQFRSACKKDYSEIESGLDKLEKALKGKNLSAKPSQVRSKLEKLRNQFTEIEKIDFFHSPNAKQVLNRLNKIQQKSFSPKTQIEGLPSFSISEYENKKWVTRPRPHVDRLGCVWLIRRFINKKARIRYSNTPEPDEVPFDNKGALFGHYQNLCTFETMISIFSLKDRGLKALAEIIHEIDLRDGIYFRPETEGVTLILKGWLQSGFSEDELEAHGIALFEGLYTSLNRNSSSS